MSNYKNQINKIINFALQEDKINADITSSLAIQKKLKSKVKIVPKADGILFGVNIVKMILKKIDSKIKVKILKKDGQKLKKNRAIIVLDGNLKSIKKLDFIMYHVHLIECQLQDYLLHKLGFYLKEIS